MIPALSGFELGAATLYIGGRSDLAPDRHFQGTIVGATIYGHSVQASEVYCSWAASEAAVPILPASFYGCTDEFATNHDTAARVADGSCVYPPPCWEYAAAEWVDATVVAGTRHTLADDAHSRVDLPFSFSWFGTTFTFVTIAANGFLTLGDGDMPGTI